MNLFSSSSRTEFTESERNVDSFYVKYNSVIAIIKPTEDFLIVAGFFTLTTQLSYLFLEGH